MQYKLKTLKQKDFCYHMKVKMYKIKYFIRAIHNTQDTCLCVKKAATTLIILPPLLEWYVLSPQSISLQEDKRSSSSWAN